MTAPTAAQDAQAPDERRSAALARERAEWTARRTAMQSRVDAMGAELERIAATLTHARREAVQGAERDEVIAALLGRQRALEAERDELTPRIALALEGEADVHARFLAARDDENAAVALERAQDLAGRARASDVAIDTAIRDLRQLLRDRASIDDDARLLAQRGLPGVAAAVAGTAFDAARLPVLGEPDLGPRLHLPRV